MRLHVLLFATLREVTGAGELSWTAPDGATLGDFLDAFVAAYPRLAPHRKSMLLAVNQDFAEASTALRDGDEVALMPPVSGGAA